LELVVRRDVAGSVECVRENVFCRERRRVEFVGQDTRARFWEGFDAEGEGDGVTDWLEGAVDGEVDGE
jgi:hypothetical protein